MLISNLLDNNYKMGIDKNYGRKIVNIYFLCFEHSKEPSHREGAFEYQQQKFG